MAAGRARLSQRRRLRPGPSGLSLRRRARPHRPPLPAPECPRSAMPRYSAGRVLQRRTASASGSPSRIRLRSARSMVSTLPARPPSARRTVLAALEDAVRAEAILAVGHAGGGDGVGDAVQARHGAQGRACGALVDMLEVEDQLGRGCQRQGRANRPGAAVVQAGHGVVEMGEARGTRGQRRARLGVVAGGVADLGADAPAPERGQQLARRDRSRARRWPPGSGPWPPAPPAAPDRAGSRTAAARPARAG